MKSCYISSFMCLHAYFLRKSEQQYISLHNTIPNLLKLVHWLNNCNKNNAHWSRLNISFSCEETLKLNYISILIWFSKFSDLWLNLSLFLSRFLLDFFYGFSWFLIGFFRDLAWLLCIAPDFFSFFLVFVNFSWCLIFSFMI